MLHQGKHQACVEFSTQQMRDAYLAIRMQDNDQGAILDQLTIDITQEKG
ncbi:hypothetical protein [Paenibacillus guangzhouensis]|nr:hypothetical protein [Paenibacillus guangzhouensis]